MVSVPLDEEEGDDGHDVCNIYVGMRVMLTQNRDKDSGFVNGQSGVIVNNQNNTIFVELHNKTVIPVHRVTYMNTNNQRLCCYPLVPTYSMAICKAQGQTLSGALIWLDTQYLDSATTYVALSRVKSLDDLAFFTPVTMSHFGKNNV